VPTPLPILLDPSVKHGRVEEAVTKLWKSRERAAYGLCLGLRRLYRDQVHRSRGRARFGDWVEQRFHIPAKLAATFSWIGSRLEELPLTQAAMETGDLTYTKLREYLNLITPETEAEWIQFARTHTNREIEARVRRKQRKAGAETTRVNFELTAPERQAVRKAREVLQKRTGKSIRPGKLLGAMAKTIAEEGLFDSGKENGNGNVSSKRPSAYVSFQPCPICLDTVVPVPEGLLRVPAKEWVEAIRNGAEVFDLTDHFF